MTDTPKVLNHYHLKKTGYPPGAVYVGRGQGARGQWGNPFVIGEHGDRDEVIAAHREWVLTQPALVERIKAELAGRDLVCFCAPAPCHGDTLLEIANAQ